MLHFSTIDPQNGIGLMNKKIIKKSQVLLYQTVI